MIKAFSMIELVVSIVVIGIAMMTLPLMLTTIEENNSFAVQQEAILMARTHIGDIVTYSWDENSTNSSFDVAVLDTDSSYYKREENTTRRVGHVKADKRRKFFTHETSSTAIGQEGSAFNDIDDFDDKNGTFQGTINSIFGYKISEDDMTISASVRYVLDTNTTPFDFNISSRPIGTTNIKMIEVSLKDTLLEGNITLRAFSSNIGANQLLRRKF